MLFGRMMPRTALLFYQPSSARTAERKLSHTHETPRLKHTHLQHTFIPDALSVL